MSRYQPAQGRGGAGGGGGKNKAGGGGGAAKAHHPTPHSTTRSKASHTNTKPMSTSRNASPSTQRGEPLLNTHDLSPGGSSASDEEDPDRTRVGGRGGGKGGKEDVEMMDGASDDEEDDEDAGSDEEDEEDDDDDDEGGWNADEVTLVLPPSVDGGAMDESEGEEEDEDEERTTAEINEMLQELGTKEYARLRKDLQEGVQPIYNSLQTLHSQANKHAKTLATHKNGEIVALQDLFDRLGTQGREAFAFTKDYEEQKETLLIRWEEAHSRKEERKLKFLEDVAKLRRTNQTKHEELLTEAGDAYASFTNKANHIGSEKEYNREVNRTMKRGLPGGK